MEKEDNEEKWNSFFYPNSNVFINKLDIKDEKELLKKESELSFERLVDLYESPINGSFDADHLSMIHNYLFQDLYSWAGEYRNVNISKNQSNFADYRNIKTSLDYELALMNKDINQVYNKDMLSYFLADYYVALLDIHPFRDGNGRTIREFLREFTLTKTRELGFGEYELDFSKMDSQVIDAAMVNAKFFKSPIIMEFNKALVNKELTETGDYNYVR